MPKSCARLPVATGQSDKALPCDRTERRVASLLSARRRVTGHGLQGWSFSVVTRRTRGLPYCVPTQRR